MKSKNEKVQRFLDDIAEADNEKFEILQKLREVVFRKFSEVSEVVKYGGIMFSLENQKDFGGLFVYKDYVSFEFSNGAQFSDPQKFLEGKGKFRRHLKIRFLAEIKTKNTEFFIAQIKNA